MDYIISTDFIDTTTVKSTINDHYDFETDLRLILVLHSGNNLNSKSTEQLVRNPNNVTKNILNNLFVLEEKKRVINENTDVDV